MKDRAVPFNQPHAAKGVSLQWEISILNLEAAYSLLDEAGVGPCRQREILVSMVRLRQLLDSRSCITYNMPVVCDPSTKRIQ